MLGSSVNRNKSRVWITLFLSFENACASVHVMGYIYEGK